jgi:hypothetical protein
VCRLADSVGETQAICHLFSFVCVNFVLLPLRLAELCVSIALWHSTFVLRGTWNIAPLGMVRGHYPDNRYLEQILHLVVLVICTDRTYHNLIP